MMRVNKQLYTIISIFFEIKLRIMIERSTSCPQTDSPSIMIELRQLGPLQNIVNLIPQGDPLEFLHDFQEDLITIFVPIEVEYRIVL